MAIKKIKRQFLQRKFQKELNLYPNTKTLDTKIIHSIGVLTTNELSEKIDIVEKIKVKIPTVRTVQLYSLREFDSFDEKSFKHFTAKDINWKGMITDVSLEAFVENPFDMLIGYFDEPNLYLEYSSLQSKATFKVGFAMVNDKIFNLVVSEKVANIDSFLEVVHQYLKVFKKV